MTRLPPVSGLLVLPRLRIQNANAISASLTWGFPSMTAFVGLMWKLERFLGGKYPLMLNGIGVVCHAFSPQVSKEGFTRSFCLTRNPVDKDGSSASITEEGRVHLEVTLVLGVAGGLVPASPEERHDAATFIFEQVTRMRIAGGTVLPTTASQRPELLVLESDADKQMRQFRRIRNLLLPGFCLVDRNDLLETRFQQMVASSSDATRLDAWLDLARLNWKSTVTHDETGKETITWQHDHTEGWIVPIPVGYGSLTDVCEPGTVANTRDSTTNFRFVESLYGIGQWIGPHHLTTARQLLWYASTDSAAGLYRCCNDYSQNL